MTGMTLGINCVSHDAAAALIDSDGTVQSAIAEERLSREKADSRYPELAIAAVLDQAGCDPGDVERVGIAWDPWKMVGSTWRSRSRPRWVPTNALQLLVVRRRASRITPRRVPAVFVRHHLAHALSAFHTAPFDPTDTVALVMDGSGDCDTTTIWRYRDGKPDCLWSARLPHSLGFAWAAVARFAGLRGADKAGKLMGLGATGDPRFADALRPAIGLDAEWRLRVERSWFDFTFGPRTLAPFHAAVGAGPNELGAEPRAVDRDLAASMQVVLTDVISDLGALAAELSGCRHLALAGGVALNGVANAALAASGRFDRIWVVPSAGDDGTALGAAWAVAGTPARPTRFSPYLGREWSSMAIVDDLRRGGISAVVRQTDPVKATAEALAGGGWVAAFTGRDEFGPRALGARSLLAPPSPESTRDRLNRAAGRELYRPFAPCVLADEADRWFTGAMDHHMLYVAAVRPERRAEIPAVVHVDGSARVQLVDDTDSRFLMGVLQTLRAMGRPPLLLNTSLNVSGEPIVSAPSQAHRTAVALGATTLAFDSGVVDLPAA